MCFFPYPNLNYKSYAYKRGVTEFKCGACPECLHERQNYWSLRAVYEAKAHMYNCMITLTYDNFLRDSSGKIQYDVFGKPLETSVDPDLKVNRRDLQLFFKRLRKWYSTISYENIKYIACAEYGSRTHRAHYHVILFGVRFPDIHFYKRSKRGNVIYMSDILTSLWSRGICTVDSISIHSSIAKYCTKYCAKSRSDDTFMLTSNGIGLSELLKDFNGLNYFIDGREYAIPRCVWQSVIMDRYSKFKSIVDFRYVNHNPELYDNPLADDSLYQKARADRKRYRYLRDRDPQYIAYLAYWKKLGEQFALSSLPVSQRIYLLDDTKYHNYKIAALQCLSERKKFRPVPAPGSNCVSYYERYKFYLVPHLCPRNFVRSVACRISSCPNTASDTNFVFDPFVFRFVHVSLFDELSFSRIQNSIFDTP